MNALDICTRGFLSNNPVGLGYTLLGFEIEENVETPPNQSYYDLGVGAGGAGGAAGGAGGAGFRPSSNTSKKRITVKFRYNDNTYEETKYLASTVKINIDDIEIAIVDDKPTVVFRNLELKYGNIDNLQEQARSI